MAGFTIYRRGLACVILLAALVIYLTFRMLIADVSAYQAGAFLKDWSERGEVPSDSSWRVGAGAGERAVSLFPVANGAYLERLGRIHEWRYQGAFPGNPGAEGSRQKALNSYRQALMVRPYWPYAWGRLAAVKMKLLQFDDEFDEALNNAHRYAPWRPRVNYVVGRVGLTAWRNLSAEQRDLVRRSIDNLQVNDSKRADRLLAYGETLGVADQLVGDSHTTP